MPSSKRVVKVFIASPGGLEEARRAFKDTIDDLNRSFGDGCGVEFKALGWEDTFSETGVRTQSVINRDIESCDLFLLVLDKLWGRKNNDATIHQVDWLPSLQKLRPSNTMEEYSLALSRKERVGRPAAYSVFKKIPSEFLRDPGVELKQVLKLRKMLAKSNRDLFYEWETVEEFQQRVDGILRRFVREGEPLPDASPAAHMTFEPGEEFRNRLAELMVELARAQEAKRRAERRAAEFATKKLRRGTPTKASKAARERSRARASRDAERARSEELALTVAERAAQAALEGRVEEARQDFAKAVDGTTSLRVLFLGFEFFLRVGDLDESERLLRRWLAITGPSAETADTAAALGNLGNVLFTRGDFDRAEKMYRRALAVSQKLNDLQAVANQYGNLCNIRLRHDDLEGAEEMCRKALEICEKLKNDQGIANQSGNLGNILFTSGHLDAAEGMYRKALAIDKKLNRGEGLAKHYGNLGAVAVRRGDLSVAEAMQRKALEINERLGRLEGMASDYSNLGGVMREQGKLLAAREYWTKAHDLYARVGALHKVKPIQGWLDMLDEPQNNDSN